MNTNLLIAGVGGQGTLLASKLLGSLLVSNGFDVKVSEVHGMSQRGGSVITMVRWGETVDSPLVLQGEADYLLAFEELETFRWTPFLKPGSLAIMNQLKIDPMPVIMGSARYPSGIAELVEKSGIRLIPIDATSLARASHSPRSVNVVLLGVLARHLPFPLASWIETLRKVLPPKYLEKNLVAFDLGYNAVPNPSPKG